MDIRREQLTRYISPLREGGSLPALAELPVEERFRWLSTVKSACLATSRPHPGLTSDPDITFNRLFTELVK